MYCKLICNTVIVLQYYRKISSTAQHYVLYIILYPHNYHMAPLDSNSTN